MIIAMFHVCDVPVQVLVDCPSRKIISGHYMALDLSHSIHFPGMHESISNASHLKSRARQCNQCLILKDRSLAVPTRCLTWVYRPSFCTGGRGKLKVGDLGGGDIIYTLCI